MACLRLAESLSGSVPSGFCQETRFGSPETPFVLGGGVYEGPAQFCCLWLCPLLASLDAFFIGTPVPVFLNLTSRNPFTCPSQCLALTTPSALKP